MKRGNCIFLILPFVLVSFGLAFGGPKDTLVIAQGVDPTTLDPMNHMETPAFNVCLNLYDTLLQRSPDLKIEPLLATSYKLINDFTWEIQTSQGGEVS